MPLSADCSLCIATTHPPVPFYQTAAGVPQQHDCWALRVMPAKVVQGPKALNDL